jgi:hypothetical protein
MNKHPLDLLCLGAGAMFTLFALGYLLVPASMHVAVVIPAMLVGLGLFGILAAVVAQNRNQQALDNS